MEIKLNLATASLKDAEHAIFIIGAYFGLTQATVADVRVGVPGQDLTVSGSNTPPPGPVLAPQFVAGTANAEVPGASVAPVAENPAAAVFAPPATLPPGAGEAPDTRDPAQVFAGNVPPAPPAGVPAGTASPATPAPSAPIAAAPVGTPVPPPPAPVVSAPPGVPVDADGLPWDSRIHASGEGGTKPINKDGRWRAKRGLNDGALVARVQAELRAAMAAGGPPPTPVVAGSNPSGGMAPPVVPAAPAVAPVPPTAPPAASLPPAPPVAPSAPVAPTTFEQLMPRVTKAAIDKVIPGDALLAACKAYDVPTVPALAHRPDLVPYVWTYLQQQYPALV